MRCQLQFSGISFCGSDIGGFFGDPEEELFVRWYQAAAYQPFFRSHASFDSKRREPYLLNETPRSIVRDAIKKRYALLPLWYTMFYEHERFGAPVMRPMLSGYPLDKNVFRLDDQYMLSDKLLVRPVLNEGVTKVNVHFPSIDGDKKGERWYDTDDYKLFESVGVQVIDVDAKKTPVYQRGGTIIPKKEIIRKSSVWMRDDPVALIIAVDSDEKADGTLYVDDELSYNYQTGKYLYLKFELNKKILTSKFVDKNANFTTKSLFDKVLIAGFKDLPPFANLKTSNGESKQLEITKSSDLFFTIENLKISLMDEWTLDISGAKQNILCMGLILIVSLVHAFRHM